MPRKPVEKCTCVVLVPNLWTSVGKVMRKERVDLPRDEAEALDADDKVAIIGDSK